MEHTPGPWHVGPHYKDDVESASGRIAECKPFGSPRAKANARLIAAAPELLAACKAALGAFERNDAIDWNDLSIAIAKAEGRVG